jgi:hypothetical protein
MKKERMPPASLDTEVKIRSSGSNELLLFFDMNIENDMCNYWR